MSATRIDGKVAAAALRAEVAEAVTALRKATGRAPGLATVLVGEDPASAVYVRSKNKATAEAGMESFAHNLPADTSEADLLALVDRLNADPAVDGILVQLPLPAHIDATKVITRIDPDKDVDGFHPVNAGRLAIGLPGLRPLHSARLPQADQGRARRHFGPRGGRRRAVEHRRQADGAAAAWRKRHRDHRPQPHAWTWRKSSGAPTSSSPLSAAREMIPGDWIKPGATVIDVGINRTDDGLVGDVDYDSASKVAGAITPVPGGVGPMTIACLIRNTFVSAARRDNFQYEKNL